MTRPLSNQWDRESLRARISDEQSQRRFEAGSPNETEIAAFKAALRCDCRAGDCVVLGMTPELRRLAAESFAGVFTVDHNRQAIDIYSRWLEQSHRAVETIINGNWLDLPAHLDGPVSAILGDGVFGNLADVDQHRSLLDSVASALLPGGCFITRKVMIARDFNPEQHTAEMIIERFRNGLIAESEFGFDMRILGCYRDCYDQATFTLDNAEVFRRCEQLLGDGMITEQEHSFIRRYYFPGDNCIVPQDLWETMLREHNFEFSVANCSGRSWYRYYKIYKCTIGRS